MSSTSPASIRAWLRRSPQPASLLIETEEGDEKRIRISDDARNRWKSAVESVHAAGAVKVQALDEEGTILRAIRLESEEAQEDPHEAMQRQADEYEKRLSKERRDNAMMLDRYGDRLNEAFERGSQSAGQGLEELKDCVRILTENFVTAITNIHNLAVNLANTTIAAAEAAAAAHSDENPNDGMVSQVIAAGVTKALGMPLPGATPPPKKPNGSGGIKAPKQEEE